MLVTQIHMSCAMKAVSSPFLSIRLGSKDVSPSQLRLSGKRLSLDMRVSSLVTTGID